MVSWQHKLGAKAFRISRLQRIHIIGCARSGTTFVQYSMLAYRNTVVSNKEGSPFGPDLSKKLVLSGRALLSGGLNYVTKRAYGWFTDKGIKDLLQAVRCYNTGVILVLRDPRSVLRSKHKLSSNPREPYLEHERWYKSITAGEQIWELLADYPRKCTIRFEDILCNPKHVEQILANTFRLERADGTGEINQIKTNALRVGYSVAHFQSEAMHGLRDADSGSIDRCPAEIEIESKQVRDKYSHFISTYYNPSRPILPT